MPFRVFSLYKNSVSGLSVQVWLLSLVTFINRSGTMVIPFLSVYMTNQLGFTIDKAGWVLLCFGLGSVAGSFIGGFLTDRIGYYWVMFWSLFLSGFLFILVGYVSSFPAVCFLVFLTSTIGDAFRPAVMTAVGVYSKPENTTRAFSLLRMAINFGWAMGPAIGGLLVSFSGYPALFWADGITCILSALVFINTLKAKQSTRRKTVRKEESAKSPWADTNYLVFLFFTLITAVVFLQFLFTLPVFYKEEFGFTERTIGYMLAMNGLLIALTEMPIVYTLERKVKILDNVWAGSLMYGIAYIILNLPFGHSLLIAILAMIVLSIGEIFNMPFGNTYAMSRAMDSNRGAYMGLYTMTYSVSFIIGPPIGTQTVALFGFETLWYLMGGLSILAVLGFQVLKKWTDAHRSKICQLMKSLREKHLKWFNRPIITPIAKTDLLARAAKCIFTILSIPLTGKHCIE